MEFKFPDVGEGISEGVLVGWNVEEGDQVEEDQTVAEIETDKAIVEIPSPASGIVKKRACAEGEIIRVGETLLVINNEQDETQSDTDKIESEDVEADNETISLDVGGGRESTSVVGSISTEAELLEGEQLSANELDDDILATPSTRKLARELGVPLDQIEGTGAEGRITDEDVRRKASESVGENEVQERSGEDEYGRVRIRKLSGVRKAIAERMQASAFEIPQVSHMDQADVTDLYERLEQLREENEPDYKLTLLPFFIKAVVSGLQEFPILNATVDKDANEIHIKEYYNIGVGVDTEHGLMVPVVQNADQKSISEVAEEMNHLAASCRDRSIDLNKLRGGSFTITNIGFVGGKWATPKINYPEAAILATGRADWEPSVVDGEVVPRRMLPLSISFDHRIMDGAEVARFTNHVRQKLQTPEFYETT